MGKQQYIFYGALRRDYTTVRRAESYVENVVGGGVIFYVDSNAAKYESVDKSKYPGGVRSPEMIKDYPDAKVVILCSAIEEVTKHLKDIGVTNEILAYPFFSHHFQYSSDEEILSQKLWIEKYQDELERIYQVDDDYTNRILKTICQQKHMASFTFLNPKLLYGYQYQDWFCDENLLPNGDITLVDGGAYDGDSIKVALKNFGRHLRRIYAFEPDEESFNKLCSNLKNMGLEGQTTCVQAGMADKDGFLKFKSGEEFLSRLCPDEGDVSVCVKKIDSIVNDVQGTLIIKMDIEGSEVVALKGAAHTIRNYHPYLVICVYHKIEDILDVPKTISVACPDYKFYLRAGVHTECYAVPQKNS